MIFSCFFVVEREPLVRKEGNVEKVTKLTCTENRYFQKISKKGKKFLEG